MSGEHVGQTEFFYNQDMKDPKQQEKREILGRAKRIVIKIGSSLILRKDDNGNDVIDENRMNWIIGDMRHLMEAEKKRLIFVSSGAVGLGRAMLEQSKGGESLEDKQAAAAVGNPELMSYYAHAFGCPLKREGNGYARLRPEKETQIKQYKVGQVLMTPLNTKEPRRRHNIRKTILKMLERGVVPIINENDAVTTYGIRYGDNDSLASLVAEVVSADAVILLTDILGYYENFARPDQKLLSLTKGVSAEHREGARGAGSDVGTGGMATKVNAAQIAIEAGCDLFIACGRDVVKVFGFEKQNLNCRAELKNLEDAAERDLVEIERLKQGLKQKLKRGDEKEFGNLKALFDGKLPSTLFQTSFTPAEVRKLNIMKKGSISHGAIIVGENYVSGNIEPHHVFSTTGSADRGEVVSIKRYLKGASLQLVGWGVLEHSLEDVITIKGLETLILKKRLVTLEDMP
ncbi:hypothetical protein [Sneathiella limimaris]|uniref:amino acid kinase family protein n=1 Tax=Sneathiella limimaris TaxID=1964213 RepID=UPI00146EFAC1|nr:hypothetical protein [Sneathiella limimaris]